MQFALDAHASTDATVVKETTTAVAKGTKTSPRKRASRAGGVVLEN
jgi:hypothetical protein